MTLDPSHYIIQKPIIKEWLDNRPGWNYLDEISHLALFTNCHIVIVTYFIGELYGFDEIVSAAMKRHMARYHIDKVVGYSVE